MEYARRGRICILEVCRGVIQRPGCGGLGERLLPDRRTALRQTSCHTGERANRGNVGFDLFGFFQAHI